MSAPRSDATGRRPPDFRLEHRVAQDPGSKGRRERLYGLSQGAAASDVAVDSLRDLLVSEGLFDLGRPGPLWFSLVLEGFRSEEELKWAWSGLKTLYRGPYGVCLDWTSADGRPNRRLLGAITVISVGRQAEIPAYERARSDWLNSVEERVGSRPCADSIIRAALGWMHMRIPGDSYAHLTGDVELTTVSRSCLARAQSKKALAQTSAPEDSGSGLRVSVREAIADAAFRGNGGGAVRANEALTAIANACRQDRDGGSAAKQRRRMLGRLEQVVPVVADAGGWPAIIWAWSVSLVERGTRRTSPLMPSAIEPYVRRTLAPLAATLQDVDPLDITGIDWPNVRRQTLERVTEATQKNKVGAAFVSFHEFLEDTYGLPPMVWPDDDEGPTLLPRANVIWPHEAEWIRSQLTPGHTPDRFDEQVGAAFAFWWAQPTRAEDLWRVHMFGIRDNGSTLVVQLDPLQDAAKGKTVNARRAIEFSGAAAETIRLWISRREAELSHLSEDDRKRALVFEDPEHPRKPWRVGGTVLRVSSWLKAATGDPSVSMYTLRHSSLTFGRLDATDQRDVDLQSSRAAHANTATSGVNYCHLPEVVIRRALDRDIESWDLKARHVSAICGLTVNTVCQRWNRAETRGILRGAVSWRALQECADRVGFPLASDDLAWCEPLALPVHDADERGATVVDLLHCMEDRCAGRDDDVIRLRWGVTPKTLEAVEKASWIWSSQCGTTAALAKLQTKGSRRPPIPFSGGFRLLEDGKTGCILEALRRGIDRPKARSLTVSWRVCLQGELIGFAHPPSAHDLLTWLQSIGIQGSQIVVWSTSHCRSETVDDIEAIFGTRPWQVRVEERSGRAAEYFGFVGTGVKPSPSSASVSRLNALLFALWVWCQLGDLT